MRAYQHKAQHKAWQEIDDDLERKHIYKTVYNTRRWMKLRKAYITAYPLCCECLKAGNTQIGEVVDHIKAIRDGGEAWSWHNLQTLCKKHHSSKTNKETQKRLKNGNNNFIFE